MAERVLVVGASSKPERYSHRAMRALLARGHDAIPVHPRETEVCGQPVSPTLARVKGPVDTVTVYVRPDAFRGMVDEVIALAPRRVILNPGTEDAEVAVALRRAGIDVIEACTLVLLQTEQF